MANKEEVLVFRAELIEDLLNRWEGGILVGDQCIDILTEILKPDNLLYLDREEAEKNEHYKQLIPYVMLKRGNEVFRYARTKKGGEARLHDLCSIGVGGHINPVDTVLDLEDDSFKFQDTYEKAMWRELAEEVSIERQDGDAVNIAPVAVLYDPSNEVGRVHFGIVHLLHIRNGDKVKISDGGLSNGYFQHVLDLKAEVDKFENWSKLVIRNLL